MENQPTIEQLKQELEEMDEVSRNGHLEFIRLIKETGPLFCENKLSDEQIEELNILIADARLNGSQRYLPLDPDHAHIRVRARKHFTEQAKDLVASSIEDDREPTVEEIAQAMMLLIVNTKGYFAEYAEAVKPEKLN